MTWLVILGTLLTLGGVAGLGLCIAQATKIKQMTDKDAQRAKLHGLVALNMASVGTAGLGLALVVVGLIL